jgi:amidase
MDQPHFPEARQLVASAAEAEPGIAELQAAMAAGRLTARALVERYLSRIEALDRGGPALHSIIEINPDALALAAELDAERQATGPRGPLHGVPILLKENIDTADRMLTTAGSLALVGDPPAQDATGARRLREAGAVLLGKTNLSEWANFRSTHSSSGWSARGGQTRNPHVLNQDPCGSSSGSAAAIAAYLGAAALGTETDGSIACPACACGIVGLKPTVGLTSRAGVIPISHSQDSVGPMARSVSDAALLLGALAGVDPRDPATQASDRKSFADYTRFLDPNGLNGARIGLPFGRGEGDAAAAIQELAAAGAALVDVALPEIENVGDAEFMVMTTEFKAGLNAYLATRTGVPVRSLAEAIAFNEAHAGQELKVFGQEVFVTAQERGPLTEPGYREALEKSQGRSRAGLDAVMTEHRLDALVSTGCEWSPAARAGRPVISVPAGFDRGRPVHLLFTGRAYSEPLLLRLAFAFEQRARACRPPEFLKVRPSA